MNLVYNSSVSGLGPNGGSRTILLSARTLEALGHRCDILANVDYFNWFKHKPVIKHVPKGIDAIINVAAVDYESTKKSNVPIKVAWWRGNETWSNTEDHLKYCYMDTEVKNIVNSKGLQSLLSSYGAKSEVVYQGIDFDLWEDRERLRLSDKIRIGCLYQKKTTKRWVDFVELAQILGGDRYKFVGFGTEMRHDSFLDFFISNPTHDELINFYSSCHIFFCPTELEGLHNIAIEASLCGCLIVCGDSLMNGMCQDYAFYNDTAMVYEARNVEQAAAMVRIPDWKLVNRMQDYLKFNIGSRETNMKKMIKHLEEL